MNKKNLTEADIRIKFITPALDKDKLGSWDVMTQLGTPVEIIGHYGGKEGYRKAIREMETMLYAA